MHKYNVLLIIHLLSKGDNYFVALFVPRTYYTNDVYNQRTVLKFLKRIAFPFLSVVCYKCDIFLGPFVSICSMF